MDVYTLDFTTYVMCSIPLTGIQKEVLVGTLLGDASLERAKPTHNTARSAVYGLINLILSMNLISNLFILSSKI